MDPERWAQVDKILQSVLTLEARERDTYLQEACQGDNSLRAAVESLIDAYEQAGEFLNRPAIDLAAICETQTQPPYRDPYIGIVLKDRYLIERELGRGGIGVVYLALDKQLVSKPVVIKVLLESPAQDEWLKKKFQQEIEALARVDHPGIVGVFDVGQMPDGKPFFVMQFVKGVTLRSEIKSAGMELARVGRLARQIGQALTAAHELGIYHRDLKPENIMVQDLGEGEELAKIIDFGIARVERSKTATNTTAPVLVGTYSYMAPEQLVMEPVSAATDIYAFGLIVYEMIVGQRPFNTESIFKLRDLQREGVKELPKDLRPELPASAQAAILKALSYQPQSRYQRARDFGDELARALPAGERVAHNPTNKRTPAETDLTESEPTRALKMRLTPDSAAILPKRLEPVGGAVPLDSKFYIVRAADEEFRAALAHRDSIVLVKGARQMGKTSLLARGLQKVRESGAKVVLTDFQTLSSEQMSSPDTFFLALAEMVADQLDLERLPKSVWHPDRGATMNFVRYLQREVLNKLSSPLVWGMDEVDRLFNYEYSDEVFGLFRSWHNARSLDPSAPWHKLTLAMAYATEVHLFIKDMNQSPFNVGTQLVLEDFDLEQVEDLNRRHGAPLKDENETARFYRLLSGHPYLVRRGLHEMVTRNIGIEELEAQADRDKGPFGDHLRRMLALITQDEDLRVATRDVINGVTVLKAEIFYRLRSAGVMTGESAQEARLHCQLYEAYLKRHLM